jgi:hypothetical protein
LNIQRRKAFKTTYEEIRMKSIDFTTQSCAATAYMLNATQQWNTKGNFLSKMVVSRVIGMIGVSSASLVDAAGNLALGVSKMIYAMITGTCEIVGAPFGLKGRINPLKLKHANKEEAMIHLCKAVGHVGLAFINLAPAFVAPSALQIPLLVACGIKQPKALQTGMFKKLGNLIKKAIPSKETLKKAVPSKKAAAIGVVVVGAGLAAYKFDLLPRWSTIVSYVPAMPSFVSTPANYVAGVVAGAAGSVWGGVKGTGSYAKGFFVTPEPAYVQYLRMAYENPKPTAVAALVAFGVLLGVRRRCKTAVPDTRPARTS